MVAFVNHFLIDTAKFLNSFLVNCENKFIELESRLQKINAELTIIESKVFQGELVSVFCFPVKFRIAKPHSLLFLQKNPAAAPDEAKPQLDTDTVDKKSVSESENSNTFADDNQNTSQEVPTAEPESPEIDGVRVCDDIRYDKYFKMKQFGVPAEAVKLKMSAEGLDASLLE